MKFYYFNDEKVPVTIQVNHMQSNLMDTNFTRYETILPQEGKVIEFEAPENSIPYLKRWESRQILLTYIRVEVLERLSHYSEQEHDKN